MDNSIFIEIKRIFKKAQVQNSISGKFFWVDCRVQFLSLLLRKIEYFKKDIALFQPTNKDMTEYLLDLQGHRRRVTMVEWHPTAENILVSAGYDHQIFVWNISKGVPVKLINCHNDVIYSMSFNR